MRSLITETRTNYFNEIASQVPKLDVQLIVVTHLLEDRPELLSSLSAIAPINLLIGIPYSNQLATVEQLKKDYNVVTPSLPQLQDKAFLFKLLADYLDKSKPIIIIEIGGYFAPFINEIHNELNYEIVGVIEDTEKGHRQHEKHIDDLPCPVISVARSKLKESEDDLIGSSCVFSTDRLLRSVGFSIEGKSALVLGYGKIGRGLAKTLHQYQCPTCVYDINPIRQIAALSNQCQVKHKEWMLNDIDIIFGTTGECSISIDDLRAIRNQCILVSCSSRDSEFDLAYIKKHYTHSNVTTNLDYYENEDNNFYIANNGTPINFIDGAVIGPVLALIQAEIIISIKELCQMKEKKGLFETSEHTKRELAQIWMKHFYQASTGHYVFDKPKTLAVDPVEERRIYHVN